MINDKIVINDYYGRATVCPAVRSSHGILFLWETGMKSPESVV